MYMITYHRIDGAQTSQLAASLIGAMRIATKHAEKDRSIFFMHIRYGKYVLVGRHTRHRKWNHYMSEEELLIKVARDVQEEENRRREKELREAGRVKTTFKGEGSQQ